jgi:hypothetical protein
VLRTDQDYLDAGYHANGSIMHNGRSITIWAKEHTRESWSATGRAFRNQEAHYATLSTGLPSYPAPDISSRFD